MRLAAIFFLAAAPLMAANSACDIATTPAATLLLPYFDVDVAHTPPARTTMFSIVNVSPRHAIARVTLWTDYGVPLLSFNVGMNGYGTDSIDLHDVLTTGRVARHGRLCPQIDVPESSRVEAVAALTAGRLGGCNTAGNRHAHAIGYATIDVVANCHARTPASADYFTRDLRFDNVLTGDYAYLETGRDADASALVHIRAAAPGTLPYTFYDRMTEEITPRGIDRRQPLPSLFAAKIGAKEDELIVWLESAQGRERPCGVDNAVFPADLMRFDEHERTEIYFCAIEGCLPYFLYSATSASLGYDSFFPPAPGSSNDAGGWMYLNFNARQTAHFSTKRAAQGWVVTRHSLGDRRSTLADAAWLGNGCTAAVASGAPIGPAANP